MSMGRRKSDKTAQRLLHALLALSISLGCLAAYTSYRAIKAIDGILQISAETYQLGKAIGQQRPYVPKFNPENE